LEHASLQDVLERARRRDPAALAELVRRYSTRVFGLVYRLTGSRDVADDLLQETFLRLVRTIEAYEDAGRFESWLFRIAANLARDRARSTRRRGIPLTLQAGRDDADTPSSRPAVEPPEAGSLRAEVGAKLAACMELLTEGEREVVLLRHYSELSFQEIADVLGVPLGTALARGHRALARLRAALQAEGFE
jgi:RNA polymerase sigma-70 factor (ECF subfamily)